MKLMKFVSNIFVQNRNQNIPSISKSNNSQDLLSTNTFKLYKFVTHSAYYLGPIPYQWTEFSEKQRSRISISKFRFYKAYIVFAVLVLTTYLSFLGFRAFNALFLHEKTPLEVKIRIIWTFICFSIPLVGNLEMLYHWKEIPVFINSSLDFFEEFQNTYHKKFLFRKTIGCDRLIKGILFVAIFATVQSTFLIMKHPNEPYYLTSLLSHIEQYSYAIKASFACVLIIQLWLWMNVWACISFLVFVKVIYAYLGIAILKELKYSKKNPSTILMLNEMQKFARTYRSMQVIQNFFNHCFQKIWEPSHQALLFIIAVLGYYGCLKLSGTPVIVMGVLGGLCNIYLVLISRKFGKLYEESLDVTKYWKCKGFRWTRRFLRSAAPIRVLISDLYFVDKTSPLVVCQLIIIWTVNMLLSL